MKLWIVGIGEYSDYRNVAVFDDEHKADAEKAAELMGGGVQDEPFILNGPVLDVPPEGKRFFSIGMDKRGKSSGGDYGSVLDEEGKKHKESYWVYDKHPCPWELNVQMYARDKKHAVKVTNEIRIQILAGSKPPKGQLP